MVMFLKLEAPWTNHFMIFMLCFIMHSPQMNQRAKCNCCCEIIKHEVVCLELNLHKTKDGGKFMMIVTIGEHTVVLASQKQLNKVPHHEHE